MDRELTKGERMNGSRRAIQFAIGCGLLFAGAAYGLFKNGLNANEAGWVAIVCGLGAMLAAAALALHWFVGPVPDDPFTPDTSSPDWPDNLTPGHRETPQ